MCTIIAKEAKNRMTVLVGIPCCLSVEEVASSISKVTRENGWNEFFVGDICEDTPQWVSWLDGEAKQKAMASLLPRRRGKRIYFVDVSDRYQSAL